MTHQLPRVLVTGSTGYVGSLLLAELGARVVRRDVGAVIGADVREPARLPDGATFVRHDVRDDGLADILRAQGISCVVHLASIVTPGKGSTRAFEYSVDVAGTQRVLDACVAADVQRIVVTSSGAAYGYHADNASWLREDAPVRGNEDIAYSWHKRLVEEMLARYRSTHPALEQVILRVGTILGTSVDNQITALFRKRRLLAIADSTSPFVFIHDADLVAILARAVESPVTGIFNVAGDGAMTIDEIAAALGKPVLRLPAWLLRGALGLLHPLGLSRYSPAQVDFLRYRPVLDNTKLKDVFGYAPRLTTREVFELWRRAQPDASDVKRTADDH